MLRPARPRNGLQNSNEDKIGNRRKYVLLTVQSRNMIIDKTSGTPGNEVPFSSATSETLFTIFPQRARRKPWRCIMSVKWYLRLFEREFGWYLRVIGSKLSNRDWGTRSCSRPCHCWRGRRHHRRHAEQLASRVELEIFSRLTFFLNCCKRG